jgi:class 3 adenylate cyclase
MSAARPTRAIARRPGPITPVVLWLAGTCALFGAAWLAVQNGRPIDITISFFLFVPWAFLTSGMIAWRRRPERRLGRMLMFVTAIYLLSIPRFAIPELTMLGAFVVPAADVAQAYILLAFPADRINGRLERVGMAALLATFVCYVVVTALTLDPATDVPASCPPCGPNPLRFIDVGGLVGPIQAAFGIVLIAAVLIVVGLIVGRWVAATGPARRVMTPVLLGGVVFALGIATRQIVRLFGDEGAVPMIDVGSSLVRSLVPVGLMVTFLRLESARDDVVGTAVQVGAGLSAAGLEDELRRALHDPALTVAVWSGTASAYLDREGRYVVPRSDSGQRVLRLATGDEPLAVVLHDPSIDDPAVIEAIGSAVRLTVDTSRMRDRLEARGSRFAELPRGDVTFLFGDIEGSTELLARIGDRYVEVLETLRRIIRSSASSHRGTVVDLRADECFVTFGRAADAVAAAVAMQRRIAAARPAGERIRFRIGLHSGHSDVEDEGYVGLDVHLGARVMAAANGDQIVVSGAIVDLASDLPAIDYVDLGWYRLKGIPTPIRLARVAATDLETDDRPARADRVDDAAFGHRESSPPDTGRSKVT